jgi:hypothetical protein
VQNLSCAGDGVLLPSWQLHTAHLPFAHILTCCSLQQMDNLNGTKLLKVRPTSSHAMERCNCQLSHWLAQL